jgi:hypothetical protein
VQATLLYTATVYSYSTEHRLQKARSCVVRCLPWWLSSLPSSREVLLLPAYGPTPTCGTPGLASFGWDDKPAIKNMIS